MKLKKIISIAVTVSILCSFSADISFASDARAIELPDIDNEIIVCYDDFNDGDFSEIIYDAANKRNLSATTFPGGTEKVMKISSGNFLTMYPYAKNIPEIGVNSEGKPNYPLAFEVKIRAVEDEGGYAGLNSYNFGGSGSDTFWFNNSSTMKNSFGIYASAEYTVTDPTSEWTTVTVMYDNLSGKREMFINGAKISDTTSGYNSWYKYGWAMKGFTFSGSGANGAVYFDYMKSYIPSNRFTAELKNSSNSSLNSIDIEFNSRVCSLKAENIRIDGVPAKSVTLKDEEKQIYTIEFTGSLRLNKEYTLDLSGLKNTVGLSLETGSLKFRTMKNMIYAEDLKVFQNGAEIERFENSGAPVYTSVSLTNLDNVSRTAAVYLGCYSKEANGDSILQKVEMKKQTLSPGETQIISTDALAFSGGIDFVRAFVWDENNSPVTEPLNIELKQFEPSENDIALMSAEPEVIGELSFVSPNRVVSSTTGLTKLGYRTYISFIGTPNYIFEYDTVNATYINKFPAGSSYMYSMRVAEDGYLYYAMNGGKEIRRYDPETQQSETVGAITYATSSLWNMYYGADGNRSMLYIAGYGNATKGHTCVEFDTKTGKVTEYTGILKGYAYSHAMTGDDDYIYATGGDSENKQAVVKIDKNTNTEAGRYVYEEGAYIQPRGIKKIGNYIIAQHFGKLLVIDSQTMELKDIIEIFSGYNHDYIAYANPDDTDKNYFYYLSNKNESDKYTLCKYDLATLTSTVSSTYSSSTASYSSSGLYAEQFSRTGFGDWIKTKSGLWAIACVGDQNALYSIHYIRPEYNYKSTVNYKPYAEYLPTAPAYFYVSRDDILYIGGSSAGMNGYDLKTGKQLFTKNNGNQHSMGMANGMLFGGSYNSGYIYMLNPANNSISIAGTTPGSLGLSRFTQSVDTNSGFTIFASQVDYGGSSGGVTLATYLDNEAKIKVYQGIIPDENINSVAYYDGFIYASSSTAIANVGTSVNDEAHIAKVDAKTGVTQRIITLRTLTENGKNSLKAYVKGEETDDSEDTVQVKKHKILGGIAIGPDGCLYGLVDGFIYKLDSDTLELIDYKEIQPGYTFEGMSHYLPPKLIFDTDGVLYTNWNKKLLAINISDWSFENIGYISDEIGIDNDGNIYRKSGNNTIRYLKNQRQRLYIMIKNAEKYYKAENYSEDSRNVFCQALNDAKSINLSKATDEEVKEASRALSFAIRDLRTVYEENAGYGYPFY